MRIKKLMCAAIMAGLMTVSAFGSDIMEGDAKYNIPTPWKSKGISQVKMTENDNLQPLVLAESGTARVPIVVASGRYYRQIANIIKEYLDQATKASFKILAAPPAEGRAIFIGPCGPESVVKAFQDAKNMPLETLSVKSLPEGIALGGHDAFCANRLNPRERLDINDENQSRGTFFAALDFLERMIGCRFYFPGIGIYIPNLSKETVSLPPLSYTDTPVFIYRSGAYGVGKDEIELVQTDNDGIREWNTLWRRGDTRQLQGWHIDSHWHEVYGQTHPEYFALRTDGTRAVGKRGRFSAYRCYTSEDGLQAHINAIDEFYKTNGETNKKLFKAEKREHGPNKHYIHWGVADAFRGCACESCQKLIKQGGGNHSYLIWRYFLDAANEIKKRWPDKVLDTIAYSKYREIPDFVRKENPGNILINDATMPVYGATWVAYLKEPQVWKEASARIDDLAAIAAKGEKPYLWLHYPHVPRISNSQHIPYLVPHKYRDFILEHKDKISGMFFNGARGYSVALDGLALYLILKISWNPDLDVDACIDEFVHTMFGPAGESAKQYYDAIIKRWENTRWKTLPKNNEKAKACYWKETYPRKIRDSYEPMIRNLFSQTEENTIYRARASHLKAGTDKFFEQGRFYDLGKVYKYKCLRWAPDSVDGFLKEDYWAKGLSTIQLHRNDNGKLEEDVTKVRVYLTYDDENLYVAGRVDQNENFVTKAEGVVPRDSDIWATDSLELFLCTEQPGMAELGEDQKSQYHQIVIDPYGSIWDGYRNDNGVNLDIDVKTVKRDKMMFFEMKIPFKELGCITPSEGSLWYFNTYWSQPRNGKHKGYAWAGTGRYHDTSRFGILEFSKEKPKPRKR